MRYQHHLLLSVVSVSKFTDIRSVAQWVEVVAEAKAAKDDAVAI
jgi:hypothetical protein